MKRQILYLMLVILLLGSIIPGKAQDTFTLEGTVIQGTANGAALPESLPLQLRLFDEQGQIQQTLSADTDSSGKFVFEGVPIDQEAFYTVAAFWAGIEQYSVPMKYNEIAGAIEFPVYEITDSLEAVIAHRGNLRIDFAEVGQLGIQILLELNYANLGDKIVLAQPNTAEAHAFTIELPVGAVGISPEAAPGIAPQRYREIDSINDLPIPGIQDTQPLVPNWPNLMRVSFWVPYEAGAIIDMRFPFAVSDVAVFVREDTVILESDLLTLQEEKETSSGRVYEIYTQNRLLNPAEPFKFTLLGRPTETVKGSNPTQSDSGSSSPVIILIVILAAILMLTGAVVWMVRSRKPENLDALS